MNSKSNIIRVLALTIMFAWCVTILASASYGMGDQGKVVTSIQKQLIKKGYKAFDKKGTYGKETKWAVRLFQKDHGLEVDGIVGPATYKALMGKPIGKNVGSSKAKKKVKKVTNHSVPANVGLTKDVKALLAEADRYKGVPYVFGGNTPRGFDCSGYTKYVFAKAGITLPRLADEQYEVGQNVSRSNLRPGDLVFFETYEPGASHSGIYVGNGKFISATTSRGVAIADLDSGYWHERYLGARRVMK